MDTQFPRPLDFLPTYTLEVGPHHTMEEVVWVVEGYLSP